MKKFIVAVIAVAMIACGSNAMADGSFSFGVFGATAKAKDGAIDFDSQRIPNGGAWGVSGAGGFGKAKAGGFIFGDGQASVDVGAVGGGATNTTAYSYRGAYSTPDSRGLYIGVGSYSDNVAATGGSVDIHTKTLGRGLIVGAGEFKGAAAQGTLNTSYLSESPIFHDNEGSTKGVAGQLSIGALRGHVCVSNACRYGHEANAGAYAHIDMNGGSFSNSERWVEWTNDGRKIEGMRTDVGAYTNVYSQGGSYEYPYWAGRRHASADVEGGWFAAGGAATETEQETANGGAKAQALGIYVGAGGLNTNFNGSAQGYSQTQTMSFERNGLTGSINSANAGMAVSVQSHYGNAQLVD